MDEPLPLSAVAVRLADEGVPVRAIARAIKIPADDVYETLHDAVAMGQLLGLPKADWPPGGRREERVPASPPLLEDDYRRAAECSRVFKTTPLEAAMLAVMLRRDFVTKLQLHQVIEANRPCPTGKDETDVKMVDVMICKMRKKLNLHMIVIETVRGYGYSISQEHRDFALSLLGEEPR